MHLNRKQESWLGAGLLCAVLGAAGAAYYMTHRQQVNEEFQHVHKRLDNLYRATETRLKAVGK